MNFNKILKPIKLFVVNHDQEILIGTGVIGLIFSTAWGIKATIKAVQKVEHKKKELQKDKLTPKEIFIEVWPLYLPVVITTGVSVPCIILSNKLSTKRNAALAAAYTISETALQEYQEKTKELIGEKKERQIQEAISNDIVQKTSNNASIILTGDGESLFYEPLSDRYFKSNWNKISRAANEINSRALSSMSGVIYLSDWYEELGLNSTELSDEMGWTIADGVNGIISVDIHSALTNDNVPCGSIYYKTRPKQF